MCPLSILDENGYVPGTVQVPVSVSTELVQGEHEFIALSRPYDYDAIMGPSLPVSAGQNFPAAHLPEPVIRIFGLRRFSRIWLPNLFHRETPGLKISQSQTYHLIVGDTTIPSSFQFILFF